MDMRLNKIITAGIFVLFLSSFSIGNLSNHFPYFENDDCISDITYYKKPAINQEQPEILDGIVYDQYANGEIVNRGSSTNPLPREASASSHPLTKNETLFIKNEEIAVLPEEPYVGFVYEDAGTSFYEEHGLFSEQQLSTNLWGDRMSISPWLYYTVQPYGFGGFTSDITTGDIDGDGFDEVIVATDDGYLEFYDDKNHGYNMRKYLISIPDRSLDYIGQLKTVAAGDVNGDGVDEIAYVRSFLYEYPGDDLITLHLWVFDVKNWRCLTANTGLGVYSSAFDEIAMEPEVAMGDFDGDGLAEIVVGYSFGKNDFTTCDVWIFDDYKHSFGLLWRDNLFYDHLDDGRIMDVDLACGDFDGDRKDEIAYTAVPYNGEITEGALIIIDDSAGVGTYGERAELRIEAPGDVGIRRLPVACGDLDGDGRDEIGVVRCYRQEEYPGDVFIFEFSAGEYLLKSSFDWYFPDYMFDMGDVDCDGLAEMVFSGRFGNHVVDDANHGYAHLLSGNLAAPGLVACGDFDGDGMRLKYTGESWSSVAPPGVMLVMAAPPVYDGIIQNRDWSWTAFGKETSISTADTEEFGMQSSTTISFSQTFDIGFFEVYRFSISRTVGTEMLRTSTAIKTFATSVSYSAGCGDNSIIYHLTDYDSYKYQITYHPFDSTLIGENITIDVPVYPTILKTTTDYFEEYYNQTICPETFNHTIGQPWTYPLSNETSEYSLETIKSGEATVGQGTSNNAMSIEIGEITELSIKKTESSEYSMGQAVCGAGLDFSRGVFDSKGYEISMGDTCIYEGSVGDIKNPSRFTQLQYSFGLFVYYFTHPDGFTYQVINYFVEGAIPYSPAEFIGKLLESEFGYFLVSNWPWVAGIGGGVLALLITFTVIGVKREKQKPTKGKAKSKSKSKKSSKKKKKK